MYKIFLLFLGAMIIQTAIADERKRYMIAAGGHAETNLWKADSSGKEAQVLALPAYGGFPKNFQANYRPDEFGRPEEIKTIKAKIIDDQAANAAALLRRDVQAALDKVKDKRSRRQNYNVYLTQMMSPYERSNRLYDPCDSVFFQNEVQCQH